MTSRFSRTLALVAAAGACALPLAALAQSISYGSVVGGNSGGSGASSSDDADAPTSSDKDGAGKRHGRGGRGSGNYGVKVTPYIEAAQVVSARLSPGDDTLTYSTLAAGVDASIAGRNNGASVSLRYEHRFGWGRVEDSDTLSGIANGYATVVPGLTVHPSMPDTPAPGSSWPKWVSARLQNGKLTQPLVHAFDVFVVLPAGTDATAVEAIDALIEPLVGALARVALVDVGEVVQLSYPPAGAIPALRVRCIPRPERLASHARRT